MASDYFTTAPFSTGPVFESLRELYALHAETAAKLFEQHKAFAEILLETGTKQLELLRNAESYQTIVEQQTGLAEAYRDKLSAIARETMGIVFDGTDRYAQWARERVAEAEAAQPLAAAVAAPGTQKAA